MALSGTHSRAARLSGIGNILADYRLEYRFLRMYGIGNSNSDNPRCH